MTEQPDNLVLEMLRVIRAEQEETNHKLGALAQSMVSMRKDIGGVENRMEKLENRMEKLEDAVQGARADVRMIAMAVDEHTQRLDKIEAHYNPI